MKTTTKTTWKMNIMPVMDYSHLYQLNHVKDPFDILIFKKKFRLSVSFNIDRINSDTFRMY